MQYVKKWKKNIATLLAFAMLITNFTPSLPNIFAQSSDTETTIVEEIDTVVKLDEEIQQEEQDQPEVIIPDELTDNNVEEAEQPTQTHTLTIHYNRTNNDYEGWAVHSWDTGVEAKDYRFTHQDDYGYLVEIEVNHGSNVGYIIKKGNWEDKNHSANQYVQVESDMEIWIEQGQDGYHMSSPNGLTGDRVELPKEEVTSSQLTIHYNRKQNDYEGWAVHTWNTGIKDGDYDFTSEDEFGKVITIEVATGSEVGYIIKKGDFEDKNYPDNQSISITQDTEIWVIQGQNGFYDAQPNLDEVYTEDTTPIDLVVHYERQNGDYDNFRMHTWGVSGGEKQDFDYQDAFGKTKRFSFSSLQDVKNFGFIIYQQVDGQEWWANKDGDNKDNINIENLKLVKNVDRYVAHVYVKEGSDTIYYENPNKAVGTYSTVTLHFNRQDNDYTNWDVWTWSTGSEDGAHAFEYEDEFGRVVEIKVKTGNTLGYIIRKTQGDTWIDKNFDGDQSLLVLGDTEIWVNQGQNGFDAVGPGGNRAELPEDEFVDLVPDEEAEIQVFVHYYRYLEDYKNWNVWAWGEGQDGYGYPFTQSDDFGKVAKINLKDLNGLEKLGFIIRKGDWAAKDIDKDRFIDLTKATEVDGKKQLHVYLLQSEEMVYYKPEVDKTPALSGATFTDLNQIKVTAPIPFTNTEGVKITTAKGNELVSSNVSLSQDKTWLYVTLEENIELGETYYIEKSDFRAPVVVEYYGIYDSQAFNDQFYYDGTDLGANYSKGFTTFKVWAPTASEVSVQLYHTGHEDDLYQETVMTKGDKGVWSLKVDGDLNGVYYTYKVTVGNNTEVAVDPYARTVGVNGNRGMIVDLDSTNPTSWSNDVSPEFSGNMTDAIIYELHLRDLSSAENSGIENTGKYLGLTETGTKNDEGLSTGLDHIKEMGITHLHLLPSFDHRSIDETKLDTPQFNWGYDPQNYNSPEGSYSTDPYNGEVRVNEFKQMVQALHENGIRVVMDVVYNHTGATADSDFNKIVPGYYYRQNEDGSFSNGSGCGNETASERLMMRKFMIDSVKYWATEYNIDGFRFDLMALHDVDTMNALEEALHEIDPSIIIYGEGWTGGGSPLPDSEAAYKGNAKDTPNIAYFNDDMRDAVKGNVGNDWESGYINGNTSNYFYERLKFGIVGSAYHDQIGGDWANRDWAANPSQSISYVSAHDNNTLYDKLLGVQTASQGDTSEEYLKQLQKQANAIVLTGQGVPFLHAGVEMMRSKDGNHNSYNSPDEVNQIDWSLKSKNNDVVKYYQGLIKLRQSNAAFRMMTQTEVQKNLRFDELTDAEVLSFTLNSYEESADKIAVIHNVSDQSKRVTLSENGVWSIVANGEEAGIKTLDVIEGDQVKVTPHSSYVLMLNYSEPQEPEEPTYSIPESVKDFIDLTIVTPIKGDGTESNPLILEVKELTTLLEFKSMFEKFTGYEMSVKRLGTDNNSLEYLVQFTKGTEVHYFIFSVAESQLDIVEYLNSFIKETPPTPEPEPEEPNPVDPTPPVNPTHPSDDQTTTTPPTVSTNKPATGLNSGMILGIGAVLVVGGCAIIYLIRKKKMN